jgi:hypothetical protein
MIANVTTLRTKRTGIAEAIRTSRNLNMVVLLLLWLVAMPLVREARYLHCSIQSLSSGGCPPEEN